MTLSEEAVVPVTEEVIRLYKQHGSVEAVAALTRLPRKTVSEIASSIPNREAYQKRGSRNSASREKLIADLQMAARKAGEPLSGLRYQDIAPELGLAAFNTQVRAFGSWQKALEAAGVKGNPPRGKRTGAFSPEQCVEAVAKCIREHNGARVSYEAYREWAAVTDGAPSGGTVRNVVPGGWNEAVTRARQSMLN